MLIATTMHRGGSIAGFPLEIDITSIICINIMIVKYTFDAFLNYSTRLWGKKLHIVYLLDNTLLSGCLGMSGVHRFICL